MAIRTNHAFLDDIAHERQSEQCLRSRWSAGPLGEQLVGADLDDEVNDAPIATDFRGRKLAYDDELLDRHFITGDGRGNENIGLTAVHHVFHSEHNRLVEHIKDVAIASNDVAFLNEWLRSMSKTRCPT